LLRLHFIAWLEFVAFAAWVGLGYEKREFCGGKIEILPIWKRNRQDFNLAATTRVRFVAKPCVVQ